MQTEEQRLIDGLFSRLKQAQDNSATRDASAEKIIEQHMQAQPQAAYYMAQTILMQEAALKRLNEQVQSLENQLQQSVAPKQSSGGFLAGLFGGGHTQQPAAPIPGAQHYQPAAASAPVAAASRGGFLSGALQTAAGVAGGVMLADMFTSMFSHSHPQEIVNIIEPSAMPADNGYVDQNNGQFASFDNASYNPGDGGGGFDGNGFGDNGGNNNDFNNDNLDNNGFDSNSFDNNGFDNNNFADNGDFDDNSDFAGGFTDDDSWI